MLTKEMLEQLEAELFAWQCEQEWDEEDFWEQYEL